MQKIIIVSKWNIVPEEEVNERLIPFQLRWRIVSAETTTSMHPTLLHPESGFPLHVHYTTTVILEER